MTLRDKGRVGGVLSCSTCGTGTSPSGKVDLQVDDDGRYRCQDTAGCARRSARVSTAEKRVGCPVRSPGSRLPCVKKIPAGWKVVEGHGGGHMWMSNRDERIVEGGHFDATAALAGQPFGGHLPEECPGWSCEFLEFLIGRKKEDDG